MNEKLELRLYGDPSLPALIYLPGLHGDWTLLGSFRRALAGRVRLVEMTYPRTLVWSLDDYAQAIEAALAEHGIARGWLLGESFGSQVLWSLVARGRFPMDAVILAGGFVRHPMRWAVRLIGRLSGGLSHSFITRVLFGYAKVARYRFRHSPEVRAGIQEFIDRRTPLDVQAANHRLRLICQNDLRPVARAACVPVYALTGFLDPVVPWWFVRPWLRKHCRAHYEYRILWRADHNVLSTAADAAADQIVRWMRPPLARAVPGAPPLTASPS